MPARAHLLRAVIHVDHRAGPDVRLVDQLGQLFGGHPQGGRQRRCARKHLVVAQDRVQAHQPAHGAAGDEGMRAAGLCGVAPVDQGFELLSEPVHRLLPSARHMAQMRVIKGKGRVFRKPAVIRAMVAFHGHDHHAGVRFVHVGAHAPGGAVGGVLVEKHVVPVKHIQYGQPLPPVHSVGQVHIYIARLLTRVGGIRDAPFFHHGEESSPYNMARPQKGLCISLAR